MKDEVFVNIATLFFGVEMLMMGYEPLPIHQTFVLNLTKTKL